MGQSMPKAVASVVVKRMPGPCFRAALAEMNGWRPSMEDSHVAIQGDRWGFFGVFDGHGGDQCSSFIARRLTEELASGVPEDDAALKALALRLDKEFLESGQPSGSTGTFVIIDPPSQAGGQYRLRVGNIGDSRVLLGRADGTIVEGPGTDGALTTDHKPDHPIERERIERTGSSVQHVMGVARVGGDLAVSRAFGDSQHKQTGGPAQEDHPVSADPELYSRECDPSDFLLLVCDGISESNFPNREVVRLAAEMLRSSEGIVDPGEAATAVCRQALSSGSKDNLSCMVVLLGGGEVRGAEKELLPGSVEALGHNDFRKAYAAMADHAGLTLAEAVEMRYDIAVKDHRSWLQSSSAPESDKDPQAIDSDAWGQELKMFGDGPPSDLAVGSPERTHWFSEWLERLEEQQSGGAEAEGGPGGLPPMAMLSMLQQSPDLARYAQEQGFIPGNLPIQCTSRPVRVEPVGRVRSAVEAHPELEWDDKFTDFCGQIGQAMEDRDNGTSKVTFTKPCSYECWLPTDVLIDMSRKVRLPSAKDLRPAMMAHPALKWSERLENVCGQVGVVIEDDESDGTSRVRFIREPGPITAWFPTNTLAEVRDEEDGSVGSAGPVVVEEEVDAKRQRTE